MIKIKNTWQKISNLLPGFIIPVVIISLWSVFSEKTLLPAPRLVLDILAHPSADLLSCGSLLWNTGVSLVRVLLGLFIAILLGTPIGFLMGASERYRRFTNLITELARPLSPIALLPLSFPD